MVYQTAKGVHSSKEWRVSVSVFHCWAKNLHYTVNLHFYCAPSSVPVLWDRNLGRASLCSLRTWVPTLSSHIGSGSSGPTEGFRWLWPWLTSLWWLHERPRARATNSHSQIPDPSNYRDNMWSLFFFGGGAVINIWYDYCCFKHYGLG